MGEIRQTDRLAAVLAADIAGYTTLIERDIAGTVEAWKAARAEVIDPTILAHGGRIVKHTGDGFLAEFGNAQGAVACAIALQIGLTASPLKFRMGIGLGDILDDGLDIHGEGVNIAARIEAMAEPGGVCISGTVFDAVRNRVRAGFQDRGEHMVKHVSAPVRVYAVTPSGTTPQQRSDPPAPELPDRPSIAVLPFQNMSADSEQEYFADGIVEDVITELSRNRMLFVIARNSSFAYKDKAVDVKQVGTELGVHYVLKGSVRKGGNRVRITGQLIDAATGTHLWADRFDGEVAEIFDLQDQVTRSVASAIAPELEQAEVERSKRKPTGNLDAYDFYLRGMAAFHRFERDANREALAMFTQAFERDPNFAAAYGMAARTYGQRAGFGWITDQAREGEEASRLACAAASSGADDAIAQAGAGFALTMFGNARDGDAYLDQALGLNPNLAWVRHSSGFAKALTGFPQLAVARGTDALRLSPKDPQRMGMHVAVGLGHYFLGDDDAAYVSGEAALRHRANFLLAAALTAASAAMADEPQDATRAMARLRELDPRLAQSNLADWIRFHRQQDADRWSEGLRRAGLPE